MPGEVVFDASTAILLAKIGLLDMVTTRTRALMPPSAYREAIAKGTPDAQAIRRLVDAGALVSTAPPDSRVVRRDFRLGPGEAHAIVLARARGATCATDDGPAIRCCKALGVPFTTAVAFLVALAESGDLAPDLAAALLAKLATAGRYAPRILDDADRRIRGGGRTEGGPR